MNKKTRVNGAITSRNVLLIDQEGEKLGVLSVQEALGKAKERGLDLVEIAPMAKPPVCRIMDYGKYQFELNKKKARQRKQSKTTVIKEIKFRPGTDVGDYQTKVRKIRQFLEVANKVKVTIRFRGREMMHADLGLDLLRRVEADLEDIGQIDQTPKAEGRQISMVVSPKK